MNLEISKKYESIKEVFVKRRIELFGYIFQSHSLLPEFTIEENLLLPQIIANKHQPRQKFNPEEMKNLINKRNRVLEVISSPSIFIFN